MAESLPLLTKILEDMDKPTKKPGDVLKQNSENETFIEVAIETTQPAMQNQENQPGVFNGTSLEHTLKIMKTASNFLKKDERPNGDMFWNRIPIEILGGLSLHTGEDGYDISTDSQNVFNVTTEKSVKK